MNLLNLLCQIPEMPDSIPTRQQEWQMLKSLPFDEFMNKLVNMVVTFTINLCIAIVVFMVGKFIIGKICQLMAAIFVRRNVDKSLTTFLLSLIRILLTFVLIITVVGILGIETSSFLALFASASVAISLAFTGTLQNFAGGVLILLLKPYKVGDYIEVSGYAGTVKEIQIFSTIITTPDNKSIIIPNGGLSTGSINNFNREHFRRVDWTVSISYGDDIDTARTVILSLLNADERIVDRYIEDADCPDGDPACEELKKAEAQQEERSSKSWWYRLWHRSKQKIQDGALRADNKNASIPAPKVDRSPVVWVSALADSSVNLSVRAWTRNEHFWGVFFEMNELFYKTLPEHGLHFPFPQVDVHIDK